MTQRIERSVAVVMALGLAVLPASIVSTASAQTAPAFLPVQGFLADGTGTPLDGDHSVEMTIYAGPASATELFTQTTTVAVDQGSFSFYLGDGVALDLGIFAANNDTWVGVRIDGGAELPRFQLGSVPYAAFAEFAGDSETVGGIPAADLALAADVPAPLTVACTAGQAVTTIAADGTVTCAAIGGSGDVTAVTAGTGLSGGGATGDLALAVDTAYVQRRVTGTCTLGEAVTAIAADGTVTCSAGATGDITGVTAGVGLAGGGSTGTVSLSVDTADIQARVAGTCLAGQSIRAISGTGTVTCEVDDGAAYLAGTGITITGTTIAVDPVDVQSRVTGTCLAGQAIRAIAANGTVTCEVDDGLTYVAGTGITITGTTIAVDPADFQTRVTGLCAAGSAIRTIAANGTVTCEVDDGLTYLAGTGLTLTGTTFAVDTADIQARVAASCVAGQSIRAISATGTVTCEVDDDTDTNTTYTPGSGLTLTGTTFGIDNTVVQRRVSGTCPAGQAIRTIAVDGTVTCDPNPPLPGARSGGRGSGFTLTTTASDVATASVSFPAGGTAVILAQAEFSASAGMTYINCNLLQDGSGLGNFDWDAGDVDGWYDQTQSRAITIPVTTGAHTYTLRCNVSSGTVGGYYGEVSVMYFPGAI